MASFRHFHIFSGGVQCDLQQGSFQGWTCGHNVAHSCSLHVGVFSLWLSGSCSGAECKSNELSQSAPIYISLQLLCMSVYECFSSTIQGILCAIPLIFIIPSACFLKLSTGRWFQGENLIPSILILIGLFVMITGLIMSGLYPQDCSHGVEMFYCADANVSGTVPPVWNTTMVWDIVSFPIKGNLNVSPCSDVLENNVLFGVEELDCQRHLWDEQWLRTTPYC